MNIQNIFNKILNSLDTSKDGFSARKLTAFAFSLMTFIIEWTWLVSGEWVYLTEVLMINVGFISVLLGLTTWQNLKTRDNGNTNNGQGTDS